MNWNLTMKYVACAFILLFANGARGELPLAIATYLDRFQLEQGNLDFDTGVVTPHSLISTPANVSLGGTFTVTVDTSYSLRGNYAWIGLYEVGQPDQEFDNNWIYLNRTNGRISKTGDIVSVHYTAPTLPGIYEIRAFNSNGFLSRIEVHRFTVSEESKSLISTPATVTPGSTFNVTVDVSSILNGNDAWIGLYEVEQADQKFGSHWIYLNRTNSRITKTGDITNVQFTAPTRPGTYEIRAFGTNALLSRIEAHRFTIDEG